MSAVETLPSFHAEDSTYAAATPEDATNPPSGPAVEQTLGQPGASAGTASSRSTPKKDAEKAT